MSFGIGSNSVKGDRRLSVPACNASTVGLSRRPSEYRRCLGCKAYTGILTQRSFFLPGVAAVDGIVKLSAVYAGGFGREGDARATELVGEPETVCQAG